MDTNLQVVLPISVPTLAVLLGILINNSRLSDLRAHVDAHFDAVDQRFEAVDRRFDDMKETWRAELRRVEEVLDARLKHVERH